MTLDEIFLALSWQKYQVRLAEKLQLLLALTAATVLDTQSRIFRPLREDGAEILTFHEKLKAIHNE